MVPLLTHLFSYWSIPLKLIHGQTIRQAIRKIGGSIDSVFLLTRPAFWTQSRHLPAQKKHKVK